MKPNIEVRARCNLKALLKKRGRSLNNVSHEIKAGYVNLTKQHDNKKDSMDYSMMARLCVELDCDIQDLIVLEPKNWRELIKAETETKEQKKKR